MYKKKAFSKIQPHAGGMPWRESWRVCGIADAGWGYRIGERITDHENLGK
jgi:hypothetical protein